MSTQPPVHSTAGDVNGGYEVDLGPEWYCTVCGCEFETDDCWECSGEGGWHHCWDDCCVCLDDEEITEWCQGCGGTGRVKFCPDAKNHPEEQVA